MQNKALLLSAYDAESHRHWHQMLTSGILEYHWTVITLPAHHFYWRVRSNALSFALEHGETLSRGYDVLIATSMLDLATLRGLVPELVQIPALVYFHENQFNYPLRDPASEHRINNAQFASIVTALCAKRVLFNSDYNRRTFLSGTQKFIKRMPDGLSPTIPQTIEKKSAVLPVPIHADSGFHGRSNLSESENGAAANAVDLVWAHRWEFDKQPEVLFNALEKLYATPGFTESGVTVRLHVMGTALHDFQGLGMIEAIHQGCIPLAPNRVAYPEYIPQELLYEVGSPEEESSALALKLYQLLCGSCRLQDPSTARPVSDVSGYLDNHLISRYLAEINLLQQ